MRFQSKEAAGYQVFAIAGVNTISFGIQASAAARKGLLGFAVERFDPTENERSFMPGFKVFRSLVPHPDKRTRVSTWDHPIQSFVWDDFTAKPDRQYEYFFYPVKGTPKHLDRGTTPFKVRVRTEPLFSTQEHDVFFNRGVASSQAYALRFGNHKPDDLPAAKRVEALQWLTRELDDAILRFIGHAQSNDTLLCCFYEFRYLPVAKALKAAITRGVDVQLIVDAKVNGTKVKGKLQPSFPREENLKTIKAAGIPMKRVQLREARASSIQHNKFMVLLKGGQKPSEVWTGSTNISLGGLAGQTNVGHWVRNAALARSYKEYWDLLNTDPGGTANDSASDVKTKNAAFRAAVEALQGAPTSMAAIPAGVTPVFSPRAGLQVLDLYVKLLDSSQQSAAAITLAFGINKAFKDQLKDNTAQSHIIFMLLEKKDAPNPKSQEAFVAINASNNVYKAWGAFIQDPIYQWTRETNARLLALNQHVSYVHSKFLLMDPLGDDPIVVTGSANFSAASTNDNDENMLLIRGSRRVADLYFTEFNRLFNHYYFRAVTEERHDAGKKPDDASLFLLETDQWIDKYAPGKLRAKRLALYTGMKGAVSDT